MDILVFVSFYIIVILLLRLIFRRYVRSGILYALWLIPALHLLLCWLPSFRTLSTLVKEVIYPDYVNLFRWLSRALNQVIYTSNTTLQDGLAVIDNVSFVSGIEITLWEILLAIWIIGSVVTAAFILIPLLKTQRYIRHNRILGLADDYGKHVYFVEHLSFPYMIGKNIYIDTKQQQNSEQLHHILQHERMHQRQGDRIWNVLRTICVVVFWFNPFVWIAAFTSKTDSEYACDEHVVRHMSVNEKRAYGISLLELSTGECFQKRKDLMVSGIGDGNLQHRIEKIFYQKGKLRVAFQILFAVVIIAIIPCLVISTQHNAFCLNGSSNYKEVQEYAELSVSEAVQVEETAFRDNTLFTLLKCDTDCLYDIGEKWLEIQQDEDYYLVSKTNLQGNDYDAIYCVGSSSFARENSISFDKKYISLLNENDTDRRLFHTLPEEFDRNYSTLQCGVYRMTYVLVHRETNQKELLQVVFVVDDVAGLIKH